MIRRWTVALVLGLFCLSIAAVADDTRKGDGSSIQIPDGTPAAMMQAINKAVGQAKTAADIEALVQATDKIVNHVEATPVQKDAARRLAMSIYMFGMRTHQAELEPKFQAYTDRLIKENPDGDMAGTALAFRWNQKYGMTRGTSPESTTELFALVKKFPKNTMVSSLLSTQARKFRNDKEAVAFLNEAIEAVGANTPTGQRLKSMIVNRQVMGTTLEISGPTLKGESFNLASYKGKVVLVDFWATWCGPCVAELPHVKKVYEKYHEQGFEIVGISLDNSRAPLEKFVAQHNMPWVQIIFSEKADMGWNNPLAKKYGVNSIPATFLISREGKVIARDLRGEAALEKAVVEALEQSKAPTK
jgi:thiol-disulfide isomerase/thioredoxin